MSLSEILQDSFKPIYRDQTTIDSDKLEVIYIFWGEKIDLPPLFPNFEI